jgi:hypothetical protein
MAGMLRGSTIVTALVAAALGAGAAALTMRAVNKRRVRREHAPLEGRPDFSGVWQAMERGALGSPGARGAPSNRDPARRVRV